MQAMRGPFKNEPALDFSQPENRERMVAAIEKVGDELGRRYPLLIGGVWRETGRWITSINPGNVGQVVGEAAKSGPKEVEEAFAAAERAWKSWRHMSAEGRASVAFRLGELLREHRYELSAWMVYELDKAWDEADGEVAEAVDMMEWYGREALRLDQGAPNLAWLPEEANTYHYLPRGVGVVIPPWNFPCAIFTGTTMAPVIAGNCVIVKPASNTPIIGYKVVELIVEAGVPPGVVNFLPGDGSEIGDLLVEHPKTHFVNFVGSKAVGTRIYERAAKVQPGQRWLKHVVAEMGGKDAIIVDNESDIAEAVAGVVTSAFGFSGQKCSACSRAIVHADVYDEVVDGIAERTRSVVSFGPALENGETTVGAVVDETQYNSIREYIEIGRQEGRLVYSADPIDADGYYVPPTVFADVPRDARIATEEIFGPVLAIVKAASFDEALDIVNDSEYGLTGSIYSRNREKLEQARYEFDVGNLYFNRKCTGAMMGVHPFGGMKLSGTNAKAGGPDYLQNFMVTKAVGEKL